MINKVIFILLCLCAVRANAQKEVQSFEGGLNLGVCVPVMPYHHGTSEAGFCFGVSGRYNFPYSEWSVGLDIQLNPMRRNFDVKHDGHSFTADNNNRATYFLVTADYNFFQGKKVNPYVGVGMGFSVNDPLDCYYDSHGSTDFCFSPRVGVELLYHIRVAAGMIFTRKPYSGFFATVGFVIGGRPSKTPNSYSHN